MIHILISITIVKWQPKQPLNLLQKILGGCIYIETYLLALEINQIGMELSFLGITEQN